MTMRPPKECSRIRASVLTALSFSLLLSLISCSSGSSPGEAPDSGDSSVPSVSIGFEVFEDGIPAGMDKDVGAETGDGLVGNTLARDTSVLRSGESSLRVAGGDSTTLWYSLSVPVPDGVDRVEARLWVRGEDLRTEVNQFENRYAGFVFESLLFGGELEAVTFPEGTFDWTEISVFLDVKTRMADDVSFVLFCSVSGTLWVDDLTLFFDDECGDPGLDAVPEPLSEYIGTLYRETEYIELASPDQVDFQDSLTAEQALEDAAMLVYILENGYSGYHYWEGHGVDFGALSDRLDSLGSSGGTVATADLQRVIEEGLSGIQDGHFRVSGPGGQSAFLERTSPWFADVIVERPVPAGGVSDTELQVVVSNCPDVTTGMVFEGLDENLFRIPSREGVEQYQLGVFSSGQHDQAVFAFRGSDSGSIEEVPLPLHECRLTRAEPESAVFSRKVVDGIDLLRITDLGNSQGEVLEEFVASGEELADSDLLIVDITGNGGGNSDYARRFVTGLNGTAQWRMYYAFLLSPPTIEAVAATVAAAGIPEGMEYYYYQMGEALDRLRGSPFRAWLLADEELEPRVMGDYQGRAVFLVDRGVASSGEALIDYSRSIPGAVTMGENSGGVGTFGEVRAYTLPNSHIRLRVPCKLFLMPGFEEGVGFLPDYWLDSSDPVAEVSGWLNNPETYQFELEEPPAPELHDLGFDRFDDDGPEHMRTMIGATSGPGPGTSEIARDTDVRTAGEASLRISGDIDTGTWYALYQDIPPGIEELDVSYFVRADDVRQEGSQFDNCHVGFLYLDESGTRQFHTSNYLGSFDWKSDSLSLDIAETGATDVQFMIFLTMSGTLWVDEVTFRTEAGR